MKKNLFSCGVLVGILLGATAPAHAQTGVRVGLKAGVSRTNLTGDNAQGLMGKFGGHAGLVANAALSGGFSVQAELLYSQKGAAARNDSSRIQLNYVDLPVLLRYDAHRFFVEAGPQMGWLVAANKTQRGSATLDEKPLFRAVAVGYALGVGYQLSGNLGVGLRYSGDFRAVGKPDTYSYQYVATPAHPRNRVLQLSATYMFGGN